MHPIKEGSRIPQVTFRTRWGGDCYIFATLVMGFCDLIVESLSKRWDVSALIPLVEAAGGVITDWQGHEPGNGGGVVAAGDRRHLLGDGVDKFCFIHGAPLC